MIKYLIPLALLPFLPFLPWWGSGNTAPAVQEAGEFITVWYDGDANPTTIWLSADEVASMNLPDAPQDCESVCDLEGEGTGWERCLERRHEDNVRCIVARGPMEGCVACCVCLYENGLGDPNDHDDCNCWGKGYRYIDTDHDGTHGVNE